ncbi:conserved protein, tetratricopeptide repeat family protein, partial [Clostridium botulinum C str. Eklund]
AVIYVEKRDYKKALNIVTDGILNNKDADFLYYNRACYNIHLGNFKDAIDDLFKAVELYPGFIKYIKEDDELDPIKCFEEYKKIIRERH